MAQFRLEVFEADGGRMSKVVEAGSAEEARRAASAHGAVVYSLGTVSRKGAALPTARFTAILSEIAALVSAGVPLTEALTATSEQARNNDDRRVLNALLEDIRAGDALSDALARVNTADAAAAAAAISTGEQTGRLGPSLARQVAEMERRQKLKAAMQGALIYPAILAVATVISVMVILFAVVPGLAPIFENAGDAAPASARMLLSTSELVIEHQSQITLFFLCTTLGLMTISRRRQSRSAFLRLLLKTPMAGGMMSATETARILRTTASVLEGGAGAPRALDLAANGATISVFRDMARSASVAVREGETLSAALAKQPAFARDTLGLIAAGERSGDLAAMLNAAAGALERKVELSAQRVATVAPPVLTLCLGGIVGGASITILSALMSVNNAAF